MMNRINRCKNMMHAYLILVHNNFYNLEKLLRLLDDERNDIYIHVDKKVKNFRFDYFEQLCMASTVHYTRRINVRWGHQSLVLAELALFDAAYKNGPYHYYHLISGADLPLKSQTEIHNFFADKTETYLHGDPLVTERARRRMSIYHLIIQPKNRFEESVRDWLNHKQQLLHIDRLRNCKMTILKGSEWGSLTHDAVSILIKQRRSIIKFTKFSLCSDEMYKPTFISHFGGKLSANSQRFILWNNADCDHPYTFTKSDFDALIQSERLFARKFDEKVDKQIIDMIFQHIMQKQQSERSL